MTPVFSEYACDQKAAPDACLPMRTRQTQAILSINTNNDTLDYVNAFIYITYRVHEQETRDVALTVHHTDQHIAA